MSSQKLSRDDGTPALLVAGYGRTEYTWIADTQHSNSGQKNSIAARCVLLLAPEATELKTSQLRHGRQSTTSGTTGSCTVRAFGVFQIEFGGFKVRAC